MLRETLLSWPAVTLRRMFGCDGLFVEGRLFAVIEDDAVATKLSPEGYNRALLEAEARPFQPVPGRPFGQWVQLPLGGRQDEEALLSWLRQGYEYVKSTPPATRRRPRATKGTARRRHT